MDRSLYDAVLELNGQRCGECGSELDLKVYQVQGSPGQTALDYVLKCECCFTKTKDRLTKRDPQDRDDWYIPFGKWRDHRISECPAFYLRWLQAQDWLRAPLRVKIQSYLKKRGETSESP